MEIKTIQTQTDIKQLLSNKIPFAFSRWGDGEFLNVNKAQGSNCDGNIYYSDLGDELKQILQSKQDYYLGVQTLVGYSMNESKKYPQVWSDSDVFHRASMKGKLDLTFDMLSKEHIVYIGNESLSSLPFIDEFIEIPYNNIWLQRDELIQKIESTFNDSYKVYCFSAGMATNVFIHQVWQKNKTNAYIDVGSVFDPYVGRKTRSYHYGLLINRL